MAASQVVPSGQSAGITPVPTVTGVSTLPASVTASGSASGQSSATTSGSFNAAASTGTPSGSHNVWSELVFAFIGTAALAIIANMNERLGRVLLAIMIGFLFMWLLLHSGQLAGWINKAVPQTKPGG